MLEIQHFQSGDEQAMVSGGEIAAGAAIGAGRLGGGEMLFNVVV